MARTRSANKTLLLSRLSELARGWGGEIRSLSEEEFNDCQMTVGDFSVAPFDPGFGVAWEDKIVCYCPEKAPSLICGLIHEMGHVFACLEPPPDAEEYIFLGWELEVANVIGLSRQAWYKGNADYSVMDATIGQLTGYQPLAPYMKHPPKIEPILAECVRIAHKQGLLIDNIPQAIRLVPV